MKSSIEQIFDDFEGNFGNGVVGDTDDSDIIGLLHF
jgi:hypothetical protein